MVIFFVCLVLMRLLLSSTAVLYHVNGQLQRSYWHVIVTICIDKHKLLSGSTGHSSGFSSHIANNITAFIKPVEWEPNYVWILQMETAPCNLVPRSLVDEAEGEGVKVSIVICARYGVCNSFFAKYSNSFVKKIYFRWISSFSSQNSL